MDPADFERKVVETSIAGDGPELAVPVVILDSAKGIAEGSTSHVSTSYLIPVDEDDPELAGVSIEVPVTATVEIDRDGAVVGIDVPADPEAQRQARAFAHNLIARGEVSGLAVGTRVRRGPGPPARKTHEVTVDEFGRKVIRRTGFSASATPPDPAVSGG